MNSKTVCVIGLGYVGLSLAYHFAIAGHRVVGVDIDTDLLESLRLGADGTNTVPKATRHQFVNSIVWTHKVPDYADVYLVCVPTPDDNGKPVYDYVEAAVRAVCKKARDLAWLVIESTVAPGTTSGLAQSIVAESGKHLRLACSPERVNPGPDGFENMADQIKLVATDMDTLADDCEIVGIYRTVFDRVVHVSDTRVAELAKCFENFQRDMNIAMMNELSMMATSHGMDMASVMRALRTKPSSPKFTTGLVGGHCIPVDPYYLAQFYQPEATGHCLPLHSRAINDSYLQFLALTVRRYAPPGGNVCIIGETYKPNVKDKRNSGGLELKRLLRKQGYKITIVDEHTGRQDPTYGPFHVVVGLVNHRETLTQFLVNRLRLTIDCTFLNVGGVFHDSQLTGIRAVTI